MILTLDPSLTHFGYAVIDEKDNSIVDYGCIVTEKKDGDDIKRLSKIHSTLTEVIVANKITKAYAEDTCGSQSARAGIALGLIKGMVLSLLLSNNIKFQYIQARKVKKMLTDDFNAEKEVIIDKVDTYYPIKQLKMTKYAREAVADAIAVFLYFRLIKEEVNLYEQSNNGDIRTGSERETKGRGKQSSGRRSSNLRSRRPPSPRKK